MAIGLSRRQESNTASIMGGCALASTFTDFDGDADADLMVANDFGEWIVPNALYQNNQPDSLYADVSASTGADVGVYGMGIAIGDYDRDQDLDYYITNLGRNVLLEQQDGFIDRTTETGVEDTYMDTLLATGWGTAFIDVDNDRDLDLFVCNGHVPAAAFIDNHKENRNRLFLNDGNASGNGYTFEEVGLASGLDHPGRGRGFAYSDYDNDGDLDLLVVHVNPHTSGLPIENALLFRNDYEGDNNWLKVKLEGVISNRDAYGSTIRIVVGADSWVHDYNGGGGSHASQHSTIAHFGLGDAEIVDSLIVTWPTGEESQYANLPVNEVITITEDGSITSATTPTQVEQQLQLAAFPNPIGESTQLRFQLQKSTFTELIIYDAQGRKIETLHRGQLAKGDHQFNYSVNRQNAGWSLATLRTDQHTATLQLIHK